jgi:hypothetical protein
MVIYFDHFDGGRQGHSRGDICEVQLPRGIEEFEVVGLSSRG